MIEETLHHRGTMLVRRLSLAPGDVLDIEFRDGHPRKHVTVTPGQVDWDVPVIAFIAPLTSATFHTKVTVFFLNRPDDVPQPGPS
jgi:hypothetical protein